MENVNLVFSSDNILSNGIPAELFLLVGEFYQKKSTTKLCVSSASIYVTNFLSKILKKFFSFYNIKNISLEINILEKNKQDKCK